MPGLVAVKRRPWMWPNGSAPGAPSFSLKRHRFVLAWPGASEILGLVVPDSQKPKAPPTGPSRHDMRNWRYDPNADASGSGPPVSRVAGRAVGVIPPS